MSIRISPTGAASPPRERLEILAIFGLALILRLIGISWGLPDASHAFSYHPDEIFVLRPALGMLEGDWNPHFFNYGTLYLYLVGLSAKLLALLGLSPASAPDLASQHLLLHLMGRTITAFLGAGTIALVYLIAVRIGGRRLAICASLLFAFLPLHLVNSHFAAVDVPAAFFLLLAAYGSLRIISDGKFCWYFLSGAAVGLAAATKYTLGLGILLPLAANFIRRFPSARQFRYFIFTPFVLPAFCFSGKLRKRMQWVIPALGLRVRLILLALVVWLAFAVSFLIGCPYILSPDGGLHIREEFLRGFLFEMRHMQEVRTPAFVATGSGWAYHALRGLPAALGIPLYLLTLPGLLLSLLWPFQRRPPARKGLFLFAAWSLFFFVMIGFATERFIRYLIPLTPFLCLFSAVALERVSSHRPKVKLARGALTAIAVSALALNLAYSVSQLLLFARADPRDRALGTLLALRPRKIGLQEVPWFRTPPVSPYNAGEFSRRLFEEWRQTAPYQVVITGWKKEILEAEKPEVFVISDLQYADPLRLKETQVREFMQALENFYREKRVFRSPAPLEWLGGGIRRAPPDWLYLKPTVSVYSGWKNG